MRKTKSLFLSAVLIALLADLSVLAQFGTNLPQVAVGGNVSTTLTFSEEVGITKAMTVTLFDDTGAALLASFNGSAPVSAFAFTLDAYDNLSLVLTSTDAAKAGWARVSTTGPGRFSVTERFTFTDAAGAVSDAVGVSPAEESDQWFLHVDLADASKNVGVALVNPTPRAMTVQFDLFGGANRAPGTTSVKRTIPANGHLALFVSEIFQAKLIGVGELIVSGTEYFSMMGLRLDGTQLSALPAFKSDFIATFASPDTQAETGGTFWFWTHFHQGSFFGTEVVGGGVVGPIRGFFEGDRLVVERLATTAESATRAVVLYQATMTLSGSDGILKGSKVVVAETGTVVSTSTLKGTVLF